MHMLSARMYYYSDDVYDGAAPTLCVYPSNINGIGNVCFNIDGQQNHLWKFGKSYKLCIL